MIREKLANDIALMVERLSGQHVKTAGLNWNRIARNTGLGLSAALSIAGLGQAAYSAALGIAGLGQAAYVAGDRLGQAIREKHLADQALTDQHLAEFEEIAQEMRRAQAEKARQLAEHQKLRRQQRVNLNYLNDMSFPDTMVGPSNNTFRIGDAVHHDNNLLYSLGD